MQCYTFQFKPHANGNGKNGIFEVTRGIALTNGMLIIGERGNGASAARAYLDKQHPAEVANGVMTEAYPRSITPKKKDGDTRTRQPFVVFAKPKGKNTDVLVRIRTRWWRNPEPGYSSGFVRVVDGAVATIASGHGSRSMATWDDVLVTMSPGSQVYVEPEGHEVFGAYMLAYDGEDVLAVPYIEEKESANEKAAPAAAVPPRKACALFSGTPAAAAA